MAYPAFNNRATNTPVTTHSGIARRLRRHFDARRAGLFEASLVVAPLTLGAYRAM